MCGTHTETIFQNSLMTHEGLWSKLTATCHSRQKHTTFPAMTETRRCQMDKETRYLLRIQRLFIYTISRSIPQTLHSSNSQSIHYPINTSTHSYHGNTFQPSNSTHVAMPKNCHGHLFHPYKDVLFHCCWINMTSINSTIMIFKYHGQLQVL